MELEKLSKKEAKEVFFDKTVLNRIINNKEIAFKIREIRQQEIDPYLNLEISLRKCKRLGILKSK